MKLLQIFVMCVLLSATTGCASYSPIYSGDDSGSSDHYSASQISQNSAVQNLYDQAIANINAGDYDQAEATLERGLRIEPNNPYLWFELARLAGDYGNVKKARELASRAQSLAGGDRYLQQQIERFIADL